MKKAIILSTLLTFLFFNNANSDSKSSCPEKILDTITVEGNFTGVECGDMCYCTIILDNHDEVSFLCDEETANQKLGNPGNRVRATLNVEQFWNEYGNECSRVEVFSDGHILQQNLSNQELEFQQCMQNANGVTMYMLECINNATIYWDKMLNKQYLIALSKIDDESYKSDLENAQNSFGEYMKSMSMYLYYANDIHSSIAKIISSSFILEETRRQAKLLQEQTEE